MVTGLHRCHEVFSHAKRINERIECISNNRPDVVQEKREAQEAVMADVLAHGNATGECDVADVMGTARAVGTALIYFNVPLFMTFHSVEECQERTKAVVVLLIQGVTRH